MQRIIVYIICFFCSISIFAQEEEIRTLFKPKKSYGGFGALAYSYSQIDDRDVIVNGAKSGMIINHSFAFGIEGYSFKSASANDISLADEKFRYMGGYGSVFIEPIFYPKKYMHINIPLSFGAGGISYRSKNNTWNDEENWEGTRIDRAAFWIFKPGIEIEFNLIHFFRFTIGTCYNFTSDIKLEYDNGNLIAEKDLLQKFSYGVKLKFGKF